MATLVKQENKSKDDLQTLTQQLINIIPFFDFFIKSQQRQKRKISKKKLIKLT